MTELTTMKYDGSRGVQEHILNMYDKAAMLAILGIQVDESFLIQAILDSLLAQFGPFKIHYNAHKKEWSLNELINLCVYEEVRLRKERRHTALAVTQITMKEKGKVRKYSPMKVSEPEKSSQAHNGFIVKCHFYGSKGHVKEECNKRKAWFEKKGNNLSFICYESNLVEVPSNTWWIDSGATTHITNSLQEYL
ncbi:hypothetical protein RHGRI_019263 [Rhododendron griersonianum]|uniref:Uncharacterized protein n=1 Tax=Rhododendron griersonianum TaxID=479676 RepID=A0AAV6JBS3_9ERIC|nr:hypothetical protein RHGRI_019263 [Rhododendron griersonianum]